MGMFTSKAFSYQLSASTGIPFQMIFKPEMSRFCIRP